MALAVVPFHNVWNYLVPACLQLQQYCQHFCDVFLSLLRRNDLNSCTCTRLLGDKSPFSQQNIQGDALDRDEETARIQCTSFHSPFLKKFQNDLVDIAQHISFHCNKFCALFLILYLYIAIEKRCSVSYINLLKINYHWMLRYSCTILFIPCKVAYVFYTEYKIGALLFHDYWHLVGFSFNHFFL